MIGYVELLDDGAVGELTADQRAVMNRLERNGRRLLLLVEDLLLLSQIEARQMQFHPVDCDLRDTARAAYDALGPLLATRHLDVVLRLPDVPVRPRGRPGAGRAAGAQPDQQRREVHPRRRPGRAGRQRPRRHRRGGRARHRHGHPGRRAGPAVHPVLPRLDGDRAGDPGHRPRADHRAGDRRAARRPDLGLRPARGSAPPSRSACRSGCPPRCVSPRRRRAGRPRRRAPARCSPCR